MKFYSVYFLSSASGVLYTGVSNDLERRCLEHKQKCVPGFTLKYHVNRLVWFEEFQSIRDALAREKQIKGWKRCRKLELIRSLNPKFEDLFSRRDPSLRSG